MYEDENERREDLTENTPAAPRPHYTSYQYTSTSGAGVHIPEQPVMTPPPKKPKKKPGFFRKALVSVALGLIFGLCAGGAFYLVTTLTGTKTAAKADTAVSEKAEVKTTEAAEKTVNTGKKVTTTTAGSTVSTVTDVTKVAADVTPAVVAITNDMVITGRTWFGQEIQRQSEASGSGIIVGENDDELLIVTNEHVVSDATTLSVQFVDGSVAEANFKGQDKGADIAVIAVDFSSLSQNTIDAIKIATLGDSESLEVGEPVIAIGNALGYGQSVTTGIVSALDREVELDNGTHALIQTDAAINPGNSGGALLNIDGELIGINEAKAGGSGIEGMGYAIPISTAKPIIEELMNKTTKKKVAEGKEAYIGIAGVAVTQDVAATYDMPEGIYLAQVEADSPADEAGLKKGDIITKFDGQSVSSMEELKDLLQYYEAGQEVEVTVQTQKDGGYAEEKHTLKLGAKSDT
ncbi:MAG: trypsin-like peptidase domain-containing protein [Lachnospiraceae bacterium]|nr:trypsin-like peptidase domain-containing protein [Lachnospiraceae bacterium]